MDRFAKVRERNAVIARNATVMLREWWRPLRNRRLRRETMRLINENLAEIERVRRKPRTGTARRPGSR